MNFNHHTNTYIHTHTHTHTHTQKHELPISLILRQFNDSEVRMHAAIAIDQAVE